MFRRVWKGEKPGFPRFRGMGWLNSFGFREFKGITKMPKLEGPRLALLEGLSLYVLRNGDAIDRIGKRGMAIVREQQFCGAGLGYDYVR